METPVRCGDCGWVGNLEDCKHSEVQILGVKHGELNIEPTYYCPACGSDNIIPVEEELVPA